MEPHQVDTYVIGNYDIHFACIVVLLVVNPGYDANGEITSQVLKLCDSSGSWHEYQHSNENRKYASDNDRF